MADIDEKDSPTDQDHSNGEKKAKKKHRKVRHHKKEEDGKEGKVRKKKKIRKSKSEIEIVDEPSSPVKPPPKPPNAGMSVEIAQLASGKKISHFQAMAMLRKALVASLMTKKTGNDKGEGKSHGKGNGEKKPGKQKEVNVDKTPSPTDIDIDVSSLPRQESGQSDTSGEEGPSASKAIVKVLQGPSKWKLVEAEFIEGKEPTDKCQWKALLMNDLFPRTNVTEEEIDEEYDEDSDEDDDDEDDGEDSCDEDAK